MTKALLLIDFINEIVHTDGKLSKKGYSNFIEENNTFRNIQNLLMLARENSLLIIHAGLGFAPDYSNQPKGSPLFGKANEFQALKSGTWATKFHEQITIETTDTILSKTRVSAFFETQLNSILKDNDVSELLIAGVSTDLAVSSAARDAHDRDYQVTILKDCCAAANMEDHRESLKIISKISTVKDLKEVF